MKDLTKVIDTLDSINKIMGCMKEHTHNGITVCTVYTDYKIEEYGITVICEVENKYGSMYECSTEIYFRYGTDYIEVKDIIIERYNGMCALIRVNMECDDE